MNEISKEDIQFYLIKSEDELYELIGKEYSKRNILAEIIGGGVIGAFPTFGGGLFRFLRPKTNRIEIGKMLLISNKEKNQDKICVNSFYKNADDVEVIAAIATVVSAFMPKVAAISGAIIIAKYGLIKFCKDYQPKEEPISDNGEENPTGTIHNNKI